MAERTNGKISRMEVGGFFFSFFFFEIPVIAGATVSGKSRAAAFLPLFFSPSLSPLVVGGGGKAVQVDAQSVFATGRPRFSLLLRA